MFQGKKSFSKKTLYNRPYCGPVNKLQHKQVRLRKFNEMIHSWIYVKTYTTTCWHSYLDCISARLANILQVERFVTSFAFCCSLYCQGLGIDTNLEIKIVLMHKKMHFEILPEHYLANLYSWLYLHGENILIAILSQVATLMFDEPENHRIWIWIMIIFLPISI